MKAYLFTGQGSQYAGMGNDLLQLHPQAQQYLEEANDLLGFDMSSVLQHGTDDDLRRTDITQPAVFLFSVIKARLTDGFAPQLLAGHSLGEWSALVAGGAMSFADGLRLVAIRANAMQQACQLVPSTMAAVIGFDDLQTEQVLQTITDQVVVAANYNCPGQLVISGSKAGIDEAIVRLKAAGARRVLALPVGGAFHSPLMQPAQQQLAAAIQQIALSKPTCPIYQNVDGQATQDPEIIQQKLIAQLTAPVRWTQTIQQMIADGATSFAEFGPKPTLSAFVRKIAPEAVVLD